MRSFTYTILLAITAARTVAGVTIHYSGKVSDAAMVEKVLSKARTFADKHHWKVEDASADSGQLQRQVGEKEMVYRTRIRGLRISVAPQCEPLCLQFGEDCVLTDFVKTQFAGAEAHIGVVELLEAIQPLFKSMEVYDEGEYWETHKKITLLRNLEAVDLMIAHVRKEHPNVHGPIFLANGRIVDLAD